MIAGMARRLVGPFFVLAGALHFLAPGAYESIVPARLPAKRALVYASGLAEIAGGAGFMAPRTRGAAAWWLTATLIAVFPAKVNMARHPERYARHIPGGGTVLLARLPLQLVLIAWVRRSAHRAQP